MAKSVKVHDDTHQALKDLKAVRRSASLDEVIREMIRASTGKQVGKRGRAEDQSLTSYVSE